MYQPKDRDPLNFVLGQLPLVLAVIVCTAYSGKWLSVAFDAGHHLHSPAALWKGLGCLAVSYCLLEAFWKIWDE